MRIFSTNSIPENIINYIKDNDLDQHVLARVISQHKDGYVVSHAENDQKAVISGNLRFSANSEEEIPTIGDWVLLNGDPELGVIWKLLPRETLISRKTPGKTTRIQLIGANVDFAFIVQSADQNFNLNRLDRYLTVCHAGKVKPIFILTKIDQLNEDQLSDLIQKVKKRHPDVPVFGVSIFDKDSVDKMSDQLIPDKTYCFLGSSGVGKSSLINALAGEDLVKTGEISDDNLKGRHTTTSRGLFRLSSGILVLDTPGMREIGLTDQASGLSETFSIIDTLAESCRFKDCSHNSEPGCAVREAIANGEIDRDVLKQYQKLARESQRFEKSIAEKRATDKEFGKMYKRVIQEKKRWKNR